MTSCASVTGRGCEPIDLLMQDLRRYAPSRHGSVRGSHPGHAFCHLRQVDEGNAPSSDAFCFWSRHCSTAQSDRDRRGLGERYSGMRHPAISEHDRPGPSRSSPPRIVVAGDERDAGSTPRRSLDRGGRQLPVEPLSPNRAGSPILEPVPVDLPANSGWLTLAVRRAPVQHGRVGSCPSPPGRLAAEDGHRGCAGRKRRSGGTFHRRSRRTNRLPRRRPRRLGVSSL